MTKALRVPTDRASSRAHSHLCRNTQWAAAELYHYASSAGDPAIRISSPIFGWRSEGTAATAQRPPRVTRRRVALGITGRPADISGFQTTPDPCKCQVLLEEWSRNVILDYLIQLRNGMLCVLSLLTKRSLIMVTARLYCLNGLLIYGPYVMLPDHSIV